MDLISWIRKHHRFYHYTEVSDDESSLSNNGIRSVFKSTDGNIWVATLDGLNLMYRDKLNQVKFKRFQPDITDSTSISYHVIASLAEDDYGNIWVGTENGGLSIYDRRKQIFYRHYHNPRDPTSLGNNSIHSIYKDRTGALWLATLNSGLNKFDPRSTKFQHQLVQPYLENTLSHNNVTCFLEDIQGNLWIGTDGGGLNYYNVANNTYKHFKHDPKNNQSLGSNAVLSLQYDTKGRLWVGTWDGGLNLFDEQTETFTRLINDPQDSQSISSNSIFAMLIDSQGRFWVGAYRGALELFDPDNKSFTHFIDSNFPSHTTYEIFEDAAGDIWIGYLDGGLSLFEWEEGQIGNFTRFRYNQDSGLENAPFTVTTIYEDGQRNLWVGTQGAGLNLFNRNTKTFKPFNKTHGLPNDVINGIQEDNQGFLWISTNKGISKLDLTDKTFRNYNSADGLQSDEFIRGAFLKTNEGQLVFGGIQGFNMFTPFEVKDNNLVPEVHLTDFKINNQSVKSIDLNSPLDRHIDDVDHIELSHDQSIISFDYVALNYSQGSKNQYRYMLEGYDEEWQEVGNSRTANYTKLPPGNYIFKVQGSNNDLVWNEQGASVALTIKPPWWKTRAAYVMYGILAVITLLGARQNIVHRERLQSSLRLEHLELKKMQELDQVKSRFFANISHEFRTPLTLIKEPLKAIYQGELLGNSSNQFRMMLRNTQKLLSLTNQLLDLSRLGAGSLKLNFSENEFLKFLRIITASFRSQAERQYIKFRFIDGGGPIKLCYDQEKLEDVLFNVLSNAFKFTPEYGTITLKVTTILIENKEWAQVTVKDTGIGIPHDQIENIFDRFYQADNNQSDSRSGSGIGLALTKELVELHKGKITVESEEGLGTEFHILLPCGKEHLSTRDIESPPNVEVNAYGELSGLMENHHQKTQNEASGHLPLLLIVEDNNDMRAYITEYLETNHRILEASNGEEGLKIAIDELPELIISDIRMPIMGGVELCKKLKQNQRTSHIPVMLLTGRVDEENEIQGLEHGADYYFTKPFNSKLLQLTVHNIIQSREVLRNHYSGEKSISLEPSSVKLSSGDERFLKDALFCVEENISNWEFSVIEFGKELGLSRMQLYRKLKSITGQSANEFIRTIRLKRAAQLLEQSNYTIAEITYEVGFSDLKYFRECFKKHFHVTPSKYLENRKNHS